MEKTRGRSDDMLIIKGVNVFPTQIEEVLFQVEGCEPHYQLVVDRVDNVDTLEVLVEVNESIFFDEMKKQRAFIEHGREAPDLDAQRRGQGQAGRTGLDPAPRGEGATGHRPAQTLVTESLDNRSGLTHNPAPLC